MEGPIVHLRMVEGLSRDRNGRSSEEIGCSVRLDQITKERSREWTRGYRWVPVEGNGEVNGQGCFAPMKSSQGTPALDTRPIEVQELTVCHPE